MVKLSPYKLRVPVTSEVDWLGRVTYNAPTTRCAVALIFYSYLMCSETPLLSCNLPGIEHSSSQAKFNAMAIPDPNEVTVKAKSEPSFEAEATDTPPATPPQLKPLSWVLVMIALLTSLFLFALDNTIVANVQPDIIDTLGEIEKLPWVSVAFALGGIATDLPWYVTLEAHIHKKRTAGRGATRFDSYNIYIIIGARYTATSKTNPSSSGACSSSKSDPPSVAPHQPSTHS
jgi:hypothetical protein